MDVFFQKIILMQWCLLSLSLQIYRLSVPSEASVSLLSCSLKGYRDYFDVHQVLGLFKKLFTNAAVPPSHIFIY